MEKPDERKMAEKKKKIEPEKMPTTKEMEKPLEKADDKKHTGKNKAIKSSMEWTPANEKESRRRKPTQR